MNTQPAARSAARSVKMLCAMLAFVASSTQAAVMWFTDEAAFNAAVTGTTAFDFEGIAPANSFVSTSPTVGGVTFGSAGIPFVIDQNVGFAAYGSSFFTGQNANPLVTVSLGGTTAMGFEYGSYFNGSMPVTVALDTGDSFDITTPTATGTDTNFIGFLSTSEVTNITFTGTFAGAANLDIVRFVLLADAAAVPAPATLTLLGLGLAMLGFHRRRR